MRPWFPPLHQRDGRYTHELRQSAARHGLGQLPERLLPDRTIPAVCGFCSTGCALDVHLREGRAIGLTPSPDYPVNHGMACPKGWEALTVLQASDRAVVPMVRGTRGHLERVSWEQALHVFVERAKAVQQAHGPAALAFLSTGQITTEEMALLGTLAKFGMGMLHGDGNTRQCMASSVVAYKEAFGFDAPPYTYDDLEQSDVIVFVGGNPCIAHPILWHRVTRNQHQPRIIVVDPRKTETAMQAHLHLALRPKSDLVLLYGVARRLIHEDWIDRDFIAESTDDFDSFAAFIEEFTPERVRDATGIDERQLEQFAQWIHSGRRVSFWWTMGVNQGYQAVRTAQAIINLALMTGNIGRPGTGANSITGQCNAMGSRLFSNTTNLIGGHEFGRDDHRRKVARILGIDAARIPTENSWDYARILEGVVRGRIRALWIIGTNPAHSWINQLYCHDVLRRLDLLVVQDMYVTTETAEWADVLLPAAGWGEKEGTFINSERRVGWVPKVTNPPGEALADFAIFRLVAETWGCGEMFSRWKTPADAFQILKELTRGQPCDITGITDYELLARRGGIQWPYPEGTTGTAAHRRLFEDGKFYRENGRARFCFEPPRPLPEPPDARYPLLLITGRGTAAQWHTQTRTAKSAILRRMYPADVYCEVNPHDARALGISANERIYVESRRGKIEVRAFLTPTVQRGHIFLPMHYPEVNRLTHPSFDPYSHQPSYKACAVSIGRLIDRRLT